MDAVKQPLVSIGIPTFNRPKGLRNTIENFIAQDYQNIEIIISDNSSDNPEVELLCREYSSKDKRIKYFRQNSNIGMYKNFEFVMHEAKGKYFAWASDDDEWNKEFISKCIKPLEVNEEIVLCAPYCRVFDKGEEIMKFKPDFNTVGMGKMQRMRKVAFYIKKSHGALMGLYRAEIIKKISVKPYLDSDGLILLQLSQYGTFFKLDEHLITTHDSTNNEEYESLTLQKEKFIDAYKMKPKYFLMRHEKITMFFYFIIQSFKWKNLGIIGHIEIIPILFRSFFGYNNLKPLSFLRNISFYLKKKKIIVLKCIQANDVINLNELTEICDEYGDLMLSVTSHKWDTYEAIDREKYKTTISSIKNKKNVFLYEARWNNEYEQLQYALDLIKSQYSDYTHCLLIKDDSSILSLTPSFFYKKLIQYKYFNRALKMGKSSSSILFPIRKFVRFKSESKITIGEIILNNDF